MSITVSLETAKNMKGSGWKKDTYFIHRPRNPNGNVDKRIESIIYQPTAQEILDELPQIDSFFLEIIYRGGGEEPVTVQYVSNKGNNHPITEVQFFGNLVESLAELRIRCKENSHLD